MQGGLHEVDESLLRFLSGQEVRQLRLSLALFGFLAMLLFLVNITVAYVYEFKRGGLDWD